MRRRGPTRPVSSASIARAEGTPLRETDGAPADPCPAGGSARPSSSLFVPRGTVPPGQEPAHTPTAVRASCAMDFDGTDRVEGR